MDAEDIRQYREQVEKQAEGSKSEIWRQRDKSRTVAAGLVLCLHIGVDPPTRVRPSPGAKTECWVDPLAYPPMRALEAIGKNLQQQYEFLQPRARFRAALDPTVEDIKKLCTSLRKASKDERVLFHYNGHGVPNPTANGELWVFNKQFTQYVPCSLFDVGQWLGFPAICVLDCAGAGALLDAFAQLASEYSAINSLLVLAASTTSELPTDPSMPADLFTCCLTTPIEIAIKWYLLCASPLSHVTVDAAMKMSGNLSDRKTPLGELNWVFTTITDTIAWQVFPPETFHSLFRQDAAVSSLFRNYLLAERILKSFGVTPFTVPALPATDTHPLWDLWDWALDGYLSRNTMEMDPQSGFFGQQLRAFELWLDSGLNDETGAEYLTVILQALLSQSFRGSALQLVDRFLDLGRWAVDNVLLVGMFPYLHKLLQSPLGEYSTVLLRTWLKILLHSNSCRADLLRDDSFQYFVKAVESNDSTLETLGCAALSMFTMDSLETQSALIKRDGLPFCLSVLQGSACDEARCFAMVILGNLVSQHVEFKFRLAREYGLDMIISQGQSENPNLRAAFVYFSHRFALHVPGSNENLSNASVLLLWHSLSLLFDMDETVRNELAVLLSQYSISMHDRFVRKSAETIAGAAKSQTVVDVVWLALLVLSVNDSDAVALRARSAVDRVHLSADIQPRLLAVRRSGAAHHRPHQEQARAHKRPSSLELDVEMRKLSVSSLGHSLRTEQISSASESDLSARPMTAAQLGRSTFPSDLALTVLKRR